MGLFTVHPYGDLSSSKSNYLDCSRINKDSFKAINTNFRVLDYLCKNYKGKIHISLGMTTKMEEEKILEIFEENLRLDEFSSIPLYIIIPCRQ